MAARKKTAKKKVSKRVARRRQIQNHGSIEDAFDQETGQLLNIRHELFAQTWVQTFDKQQTLAAIGNKPKTPKQVSDQARTYLRRDDIQKRIRDIISERIKDLAITRDWVLLEMLDLIKKGKEQIPITNKDGDIIGYEYADLRTASMNVAKIGEELGMFQKKDDKPQRNVVIVNNYGDQAEPKITHEPLEGEAQRLN